MDEIGGSTTSDRICGCTKFEEICGSTFVCIYYTYKTIAQQDSVILLITDFKVSFNNRF